MIAHKHSPWRIWPVKSGGKQFYRVYRNIDEDGSDTESNREYRGGYYERYYAERLIQTLNEEEARA